MYLWVRWCVSVGEVVTMCWGVVFISRAHTGAPERRVRARASAASARGGVVRVTALSAAERRVKGRVTASGVLSARARTAPAVGSTGSKP